MDDVQLKNLLTAIARCGAYLIVSLQFHGLDSMSLSNTDKPATNLLRKLCQHPYWHEPQGWKSRPLAKVAYANLAWGR